MADALSRYRQAEPSKDALKRYRDAPSGDTLGALAKYLGLQGYWDRQGQIAQDGLTMAEQGAQSVRGGNLSGLGGLALGPLNYFASPITALLPTSDETYAAKDIPEWAKPSVAGTLGAMAAVMPGPKGARLGKGMTALADDVTDAERTALASRLETEAAQSGGQAVATPRDQALRNLTEAPGHLPPQAATEKGVHTGWVLRDVDRGGMMYPSVSRDQMRSMTRAHDTQDWSEVEVPIKGMYATQTHVNPDFAQAATRRPGELPLAVRVNGKIYLRDGHHRVVAAANEGKQTAKVRLIDVDKMAADGTSQEDLFDMLKRYGIPMTAGVGGAMVVSGQNMPPDLAAQMGPQG